MLKKEHEMPPLDIVKIQKLHDKKAKKSRKTQFLRLFHSNPQKLLSLIKNLHDDNSLPQQVKVNLYLQAETGSELCFLIELCKLFKESLVRVIGSKVLKSEVRFQENNEFMMRLKKSEAPIRIAYEFLDKNLVQEIETLLCDFCIPKPNRCSIFPIYHPYRKNIILYVCLLNNALNCHQNDHTKGIIGECFRYCHEVIVNTMQFDEQTHFHKNHKQILEAGILTMEFIDNFYILLPAIRKQILDILKAERCNIFILDDNYLVSRISDHGVSYDTFKKEVINNVKIPVGIGIPGTVAETGKSINCADPINHPLYRNDLDRVAGLLTRNLLCFPLLLYGKVYGVVEAVNKNNGYTFSEVDNFNSEYLGKIFGIQIFMSLVKKKNWDNYSRRMVVDDILLETEKDIEESELIFVFNCKEEHKYNGFVDYMFIFSTVPQEHNVCVCLYMFEERDLLKNLDIDHNNFIKFLLVVKSREKEFSFHGWQHALNTLHFIYTLVKRENLLDSGIISTMECFCMFLAALCHEMEYGGSVNPYMPTSGTTLGSLYSSPGSVLQLYSVAQTVRLLSDCKIIDKFDLEKYKEFLSLLDKMILDMDLGNHVHSRNQSKLLIDEKKILHRKNRRHYMALLLTCSDISDFCKQWDYMETQGSTICEEFFIKEKTKDCQGLIDFTDLFENIKLKKVLLQIHFVQTVCEPAFSLLSALLPRTDRCMESIEFNTKSLLAKKEKIIQTLLEQT